MRTLLKVLAWAFLSLAVIAVLAGAGVYWRSESLLHRHYEVALPALHAPMDAKAIETGHHLAATRGCLDCHGSDLGGAKVIDDPAMGRLFGPNLTRGRGGLPASVTDADLERAIRHGVGMDGHGLFLMPSADYSRFTESDMADLIAYIRSVPPVDRETVALKIGPVARILVCAGKITLAADLIDHAHLRPDVVAVSETAEYGRYVAVSCTGCHRDNFSGGKIAIGPPGWPAAANLTPHPSGHLARWSEADFIHAIRTHLRPDGTAIDPVMPATFAAMSDTELKAIWAYLKTLPPVPTAS